MSDADTCRRMFDRIFAIPEPPPRNVRGRLEAELQHLRNMQDPAKLNARIAEIETALAMMGPRQ